jgi:hypothetical protein
MRFKLLTLFLIFAISACTFQVDVIETPTPGGAVLPIDSSTSTPIPTADHSATPPSLPTLSVTNTSLPASVGGPADPVHPIQFAPGGTYADIIDSIKAGESKTYSVRAMKGQVMSVSFRQNDEAQWSYITLRIIGADGSLLCADDCQFWRGALPATQDYFVTVTPAADASEFMMRVAVNPLGAATQSFPYENKYRNGTLSYTDAFAPGSLQGAPMYRIPPELTLQYIDTQSYADTNLIEAYLLFGSSTDSQVVSTCTEPVVLDAAETVVGEVTFNGVSFTKTESSGVGAGNVYEQTHYRAARNGTCFEFTYFIHYGNIGNYDPSTVTEFSQEALLQSFDEVFSTFTLR